jgi:hypothetical protein
MLVLSSLHLEPFSDCFSLDSSGETSSLFHPLNMTLPAHFPLFCHFNNVLSTVQALHGVMFVSPPVMSTVFFLKRLETNFIFPVCEELYLTPHGTSIFVYIGIYISRPRVIKIRSTTSFGGEVKPSVPRRRFRACKRTFGHEEEPVVSVS